jgi:hypothetical protein
MQIQVSRHKTVSVGLRGGGTRFAQRRRRRLDWQSPARDEDDTYDDRSSSDHEMSGDSEWVPESSSISSMEEKNIGCITILLFSQGMLSL